MSKQATVNLLDTLTEYEQEVFDLLFVGAERTEIAEKLSLSVGTVKYHLAHIYAKLAVRGRAEAVAYAAGVGKGEEWAVAPEVSKGCGGAGRQWDEDSIRAAAAKLVKEGLGDRKQVNALVTDLLLVLHGSI